MWKKKSKMSLQIIGIESDKKSDRCHRIGPRKTKTGQDRNRPRTVVCRLNRCKDNVF